MTNMEIKKYVDDHSENFTMIDNGVGLICGVTAYDTSMKAMKRLDRCSFGQTSAIISIGRTILSALIGVEVGSRARNKCRKIRQGLSCMTNDPTEENPGDVKDYQTITFPSKEIGMEVIDALSDILGINGKVTIADLYTTSGLSASFRDREEGWKKLEDFYVFETVEDGTVRYGLHVPAATKL